MIIGLCGLKQSGKDTVAAYLVKEYGFERKAFADPLKRSVAALFGIPFSEIDKFKNDEAVFVQLYAGKYKPLRTLSFREILQRYGTEAHRDVFGENFWLDHTLPVQGFYPGRAIVVTDVRFRNEAERVRNCGGVVCQVHRKAALGEQDQHRSEQIDFLADYDIYNDGSLDDLYKNIEELLAYAARTDGERIPSIANARGRSNG